MNGYGLVNMNAIIFIRNENSLETWAVYIEISLVSWNLPNGLRHWGSILRNMASSEGNQLLIGAFHAIMDKTEADILQIAKKWTWKWIFIYQGYLFIKSPLLNTSFAPKYVHLQGWSLKFGQNITMFQQIFETPYKNKLKLTKRKNLCFKSADKLPKRR